MSSQGFWTQSDLSWAPSSAPSNYAIRLVISWLGTCVFSSVNWGLRSYQKAGTGNCTARVPELYILRLLMGFFWSLRHRGQEGGTGTHNLNPASPISSAKTTPSPTLCPSSRQSIPTVVSRIFFNYVRWWESPAQNRAFHHTQNKSRIPSPLLLACREPQIWVCTKTTRGAC